MVVRSVGVEEELLLVEPGTGRPKAVAETALRDLQHGAAVGFEFQRQQLETNTRPCHDLDELGREIRRCRALAAEVAAQAGARVAALATSPVPVVPKLMPDGRYLEMARTFGIIADEQLTCGCHVHVDVSSDEEGVAVLDRIRPWLPVLLALSANSPFWQGRDSAYASFRYQAWCRWPSAGPTNVFGTAEAYWQTVRRMVSTGTLLDTGMVYFDARLSENYPTLELRIADVCLYADDTVLIAALARALVETEARSWRADENVRPDRIETLRLASWRASRSGVNDELVHPLTGLPGPAEVIAKALLDHVRDALDEAADTAVVTDLLAGVLARGNGAVFQRDTCSAGGDLPAMVDRAAAATMR
jgi:carboxylate-amine ligase